MDDRRIPFARQDEEHIASAGLWGIIAAVASIASGALGLLLAVALAAKGKQQASDLAGQLIGLAISVPLALWLYQASVAFRKVALSDEADQQHLLAGFRKLRAYFMTTGILLIIAISFGVLAFLGMLMCRMALR